MTTLEANYGAIYRRFVSYFSNSRRRPLNRAEYGAVETTFRLTTAVPREITEGFALHELKKWSIIGRRIEAPVVAIPTVMELAFPACGSASSDASKSARAIESDQRPSLARHSDLLDGIVRLAHTATTTPGSW